MPTLPPRMRPQGALPFMSSTQPHPFSGDWLLRALVWLAIAAFCLGLGLVVGFELWAPRVVEEYQAAVATTPNNTLIFSESGDLLATIQGMEDRHSVPLARINPYLQKAVVAIEDRRFFAHKGLDPVRLAGAVWADLKSRSFEQGGSTLTQQLVKLSLLSSERTLTRKVKELFMAMALEQQLPKLELLEAYLNRVYFGFGVYGVEKASQAYFNKSAETLSLGEAAFLAALVKKPEGYLQAAEAGAEADADRLPLERLAPLMQRRRLVLDILHRTGWITEEEFTAAVAQPLAVRRPRAELGAAPYFVQHVLKQLKEILAVSQISGRGYRVYTTLDRRQQDVAEELVGRMARENHEASQAALIALEPDTGFVRALVGGVDYQRSQFNRATQALRQPGSAFKPILYAAALEHGFSPLTVYQDEPVRFTWSKSQGAINRTVTIGSPVADPLQPERNPEEGTSTAAEPDIYAPHNFNSRYGLPALSTPDGDPTADRRMTLGRALELSSNVIAVQVLDQLGMLPVERLARRWDIAVRPEMGLCVALGCSEVTLATLTAAYASFANGGLRTRPVVIHRVTNSEGEVLYQEQPPLPEQVISPWTAFQMRKLLQGVIERGTGARARIGRPAGGKTGTNDGPRDTWFVGFTPTLVAGVWIGNDNNEPMPGEVGGRTTARLWAEFMRRVLPPEAGKPFPEPPDPYVGVKICNLDGRPASRACPDASVYYLRESDIPPEAFAATAADGPADPVLPAQEPAGAPQETFARQLREAFTPAPRAVPPE